MTEAMRDWTVVFTGTPEAARELASVLEGRGLHSFVEDRGGPVETHTGARAAQAVVLVPPEDAGRAQEVAQQWDARSREDVGRLVRRLKGVVAVSLLLPAVWLVGHGVAPDAVPRPGAAELIAGWLVALVVVAQVENRRHHRERVSLPSDPW